MKKIPLEVQKGDKNPDLARLTQSHVLLVINNFSVTKESYQSSHYLRSIVKQLIINWRQHYVKNINFLTWNELKIANKYPAISKCSPRYKNPNTHVIPKTGKRINVTRNHLLQKQYVEKLQNNHLYIVALNHFKTSTYLIRDVLSFFTEILLALYWARMRAAVFSCGRNFFIT